MPKWRAPRGEMHWTRPCSMCHCDAFKSVKKNIARKPFSDVGVLGYMFTNNEISSHYECLLYGQGDDLIQHKTKSSFYDPRPVLLSQVKQVESIRKLQNADGNSKLDAARRASAWGLLRVADAAALGGVREHHTAPAV